MTDTMRERIARVLAAADGMHPEAVSNDGEDIPIWTTYLDVADAVLAAMREPADWMQEAMDAQGTWTDGPNASHVWVTLIDAAIAEGKE